MKRLWIFGTLTLSLMIFGQTRSFDTLAPEKNPEISCLLFGNAACHTICLIQIKIYYDNEGTVGTCDYKYRCQCRYWVFPALKKNFEMRFDAEYVLQAIEQDDFSRYMRINDLFQYPLRTAEEFREILKPQLSPYQYHKLKTNDQSIAAKFYQNGQINLQSIRQFVYEQLEPVFQTATKYLFDVDYKENLRIALEYSRGEASLYNLTNEIRTLANPNLEAILKGHLTKRGLQEPEIELDPNPPLRRIIRMTILNELIKLSDKLDADEQI